MAFFMVLCMELHTVFNMEFLMEFYAVFTGINK